MHRWEKILEKPDWYEQALCKPIPREYFFIEGRDSNLVLRAKLLCLECPVRFECLTVGMGEYFGVFGGTSIADRYRLRTAWRRGRDPRDELHKLDQRTRQRAAQRGITAIDPETFGTPDTRLV